MRRTTRGEATTAFPVDVDVISPSDLCHCLGPFPDTGPNLLGWYDVLRSGTDDHGRGFEVESRLHPKSQ